jgi:hypothetical protein
MFEVDIVGIAPAGSTARLVLIRIRSRGSRNRA